jgi:phosphoribosyl 1,2-cyclic phosphate phosphodiesterase
MAWAMTGTRIQFLGTGTSVGIPAIGCRCPVCRSDDPRDRRLRCSIWVRGGGLSWLVDTGPDLRQQCLRAGIGALDAVLITHPHTDHIMGFDDLRRFCGRHPEGLPVFAPPGVLEVLEQAFAFAFHPRQRWPGYLHPRPCPVTGPFQLGQTRVTPVPVEHGAVPAVGYRFDFPGGPSLAYMSDVKRVPVAGLRALAGIDLLVTDGLRFKEHPTHMNFTEALELSESLGRPRTWLTHFSCDVAHAAAEANLPPHVRMAYDTLELAFP